MEYTEYVEQEAVEQSSGAGEAMKVEPERLLVDSLPYIDSYDDAAQAVALGLIEKEMQQFRSSHTTQPVSVSFTSPALNEDWSRVEKTEGRGFTTPLAFPAISTPGPDASVEEWEAAVERSRINYEYAKNRLELLELQHQFGANSWLEYNKSSEKLRDQLKSLLEGYKTKMEQINVQRKASQLQMRTKLGTLEAQWLETTKKNAAIEEACLKLEAELGSQ